MKHVRQTHDRCFAAGGFLADGNLFALLVFLSASLSLIAPLPAAGETNAALSWPAVTREQKPWAYWWWMGSAVDPTNLARELQRYHDAGMGGVHVIPIYGAKGWESNDLSYLSPHWMEMLGYTVAEAQRLDLGVDMTTGTGWCFGGPNVSSNDANASVVVNAFEVKAGAKLAEKIDAKTTQALVAFSSEGKSVDLTGKISADGSVAWTAPAGSWRVYAVSQKFSGQNVKRAAPGGEGPMLNLLYPAAMTNYLRRFSDAFTNYPGPKPRAQYQDSYEYKSDWSPDFFAQFKKRRGYDLTAELPALFGTNQDDRVARVKSDYRETVSDIMVEESLPQWVAWSHQHGFITRNQAHGSPGNLLDLYAVADIPETEMFRTNRNPLFAKFAASAAHVTGKNLVAAETGTWLKEHFTGTLADVKYLADDMFLSGVNHIFYHGTCYSPDQAAWPGWVFYASTEMNPRNSIWRDVPALNAYVARCQSVLQSGRPDNDILLYWPIHDLWNDAAGRLQNLKVESQNWLESQPIGKTAQQLWERGYNFDYISDRQLQAAKVQDGKIEMPGGGYRVVVVPPCEHMPVATFRKLCALAESGATIIFEQQFPSDVPGRESLESRRAALEELLSRIKPDRAGLALMGRGRILAGGLEAALATAGVPREPMFDQAGLMCVRRAIAGGRYYFIINRSEQSVNGWIPLAAAVKSVIMMDALSGRTGTGLARAGDRGGSEVYLELRPGESIILRTLTDKLAAGPAWDFWHLAYSGGEIRGGWHVDFVAGGPVLPAGFTTTNLVSWTDLGDTNAQSFAGTARYSITFDAPDTAAKRWLFDLGKVRQSARVKLNGQECGTLIAPPFHVVADNLKPKDNLLEVEVTSTSANRIRDLDRRGVPWKNFHDINFVNQDYQPFDASNWPLAEAGLFGPVTLTAVMDESSK